MDMSVSEFGDEAKCFLILTCPLNLSDAPVKISCLILCCRGTK